MYELFSVSIKNMKIESILLILLSNAAFINGARRMYCHSCQNAKSKEECDRQRAVKCSIDQNMCYTEIRNHGSNQVSITKSCYQEKACRTLASQNTHQCPRACSICCKGYKCNHEGPPKCSCTTPSFHIHTTKKVRRTRAITDEPPLCQRSWFLPIAQSAPILDCRVEASTYEEMIRKQMSCQVPAAEFIQEEYYLRLTSKVWSQTFQCKRSIDMTMSADMPANFVCINTTGDAAFPTPTEQVANYEFNEPSLDNISCSLDDTNILEIFTPEQAQEVYTEGDYSGYGYDPSYVDGTSEEQALYRVLAACRGRSFPLLCSKTASLEASGDEPVVGEVVKKAGLGNWWIAIAVAGGILIALILIGAMYRFCKKNGFYMIHRRRKITPEPGYEPSESNTENFDYRLYKR